MSTGPSQGDGRFWTPTGERGKRQVCHGDDDDGDDNITGAPAAGPAGWRVPKRLCRPLRTRPLLTCAVGQCSAPAAVPLANSGAVAHEGLGPSARVVDRGPVREQFPSEDGVGGDPRVSAGYSLGEKLVGESFLSHHLALPGLPRGQPYNATC